MSTSIKQTFIIPKTVRIIIKLLTFKTLIGYSSINLNITKEILFSMAMKNSDHRTEIGSDSENEICVTKTEITGGELEVDLLNNDKTKRMYATIYESFINWKKIKNTTSFSESILLGYFTELSEKYKPRTLRAYFAGLKSEINRHHGINLDSYKVLRKLIKEKSQDVQPKQAKSFSAQNINDFLAKASDNKLLLTKVALIMGVKGACRPIEMYNMKITDVQDLGSTFLIIVTNTKTKEPRKFTLIDNYYEICKKYISLRPFPIATDAFFLSYKHGKCIGQKVGINKFCKMGRDIATFLNLPNPEEYSGYSFRKSSATIFVDAGEITVVTEGFQKKRTIRPPDYVYQGDECDESFSACTENIKFDTNSTPSINLINCSNITIINNPK